MSATSSERGGYCTTILPIPPPLEFPYPLPSTPSSRAPTLLGTSSTSLVNSPPRLPDAPPTTHAANRLASRDYGEKVSTSRPRPLLAKNFVTERPRPKQRDSLLGMKRWQTGLNAAARNPDFESEDSSSSSGEEPNPNLKTASSNSNGRSGGGRGANKAQKSTQPDPQESGQFSRFSVGNDSFKTRGRVSKTDGRLNISVNETSNSGYLAKALGATLQHHLKTGREHPDNDDASNRPLSPLHEEDDPVRKGHPRNETASTVPTTSSRLDQLPMPTLNIVIMVIGSRGDIQPFLKLGKLLKNDHGHRVRIATHPAFKKFIEQDSGLEFFSVGGDPAELMAFMVKNPGLIPSVSTVRAGDIGRKRDSMFEMFQGFWRACINATDDEKDVANLQMMGGKHPFVADAIIANPPCFAHVHCAERLGVPLHLMFTFPYSPTQAFPHPLANIKKSNVDSNYTNFMSYPLVEMMTWQGLGDLVNRFRVKTLGLEPVSTLWAPGQLFRLKVPYTYLWSPGLVPKPSDWGPEIDIAGFVFLDLASSYRPPDTLSKFLEAGEPPVYIGFGSIVVDDPDKFTALIFEAVKKAGVRALVSKGWGGLGDEGNTPNSIYMLENTPHDWLFPRVSAVVHHGGAGTTAIGLKCGKPTMIVPFFGDQPFWGSMVAKAGAGAREPVPYKRLTADKLAEGIKQCLSPEAKIEAEKLACDIVEEGDGAENAVNSFHHHLPVRGEHSMRCSILEDRAAVWNLKKTSMKLSALAAEILVEKKRIKWRDLRLLRHYDWTDFEGPGEPFTGAGAALVNSAGAFVKGVGGTPVRWAKSIKKREKHVAMQRRRSQGRARIEEKDSSKQKDHVDGNDKINTNGALSHGGQHGQESHLPEANTIPGHVKWKAEKITSNGSAVGSASQHVNDEDEDAMSDASEGSEDNLAEDLATDAGIGLAKSGEALAKAPMDLSLAIAQGFHNAPRLYGDRTVRKTTRIGGYQSGLKAAGEEFVYGIYDGWTGLVLHPYNGAKEDGALGFVKGIGKGFGGFVLKDLAAIIGPFAYTLKGIHKELQKSKQPTHFIRRARIIQGQQDIRTLSNSGSDGQKTMIQALDAVESTWQLLLEFRKEFAAAKEEGFRGRVAMYCQRRKWIHEGAFENATVARKALEERRRSRGNAYGAGENGGVGKAGRKGRRRVSSRGEKDGPGVTDAEFVNGNEEVADRRATANGKVDGEKRGRLDAAGVSGFGVRLASGLHA